MIADPITPPAIAQAKGLKKMLVISNGKNPPIVNINFINIKYYSNIDLSTIASHEISNTIEK